MTKNGYQIAVYYFPNWHRKPGEPGEPGEQGENFGEWGTLKAAKPRFPGHSQPKAPLWGYEDESDPTAMVRKIDAAARHGIGVFLFDWYFNDNGIFLERPLNEGFLKAPRQNVQFALMWANHNLGKDKGAIGMPTFEKLVAHVVRDYMTHPLYWKIGGKPFFSIYEIDTFLDGFGGVEGTRKALDHFRHAAVAAGLMGVHVDIVDWQLAYRNDAPELLKALGVDSVTPYVWPHLIKLKDFPTIDYEYVQNKYFKHCEKAAATYGVPYYPNVTMGWDATPRIPPGKPHADAGYPDTSVFVNNTPANFKLALLQAKAFLDKQPPEQRILSLYAWNEWTEGGYLEPDTIHQYEYLEAVRDVFG